MKTLRRVLEPSQIAIVSENLYESRTLPPTVTLGNAVIGPTAIYLRFDADWKNAGEIASAFLVLEPVVHGQSSSSDVEIDVRPLEESWTTEHLGWRRHPRTGSLRHRGLARSQPPLPLRIDVTEAARRLKDREVDHGLVVLADGSAGPGATFHTGGGDGAPPRLELYLRMR